MAQSMSDSYEYVVQKKKEGSYNTKRILVIFGYALLCIIGLIAAAASKLIQLFALAPILLWITAYFTWPYFSIEYEYTMVDGNITFSTIYGGRKRKENFSIRISSFDFVAPFDKKYDSELISYGATVEFNAFSSDKTPSDPYFALFTDDHGRKCAFFFEATNRSLRILKYYNQSTVMSTVSI